MENELVIEFAIPGAQTDTIDVKILEDYVQATIEDHIILRQLRARELQIQYWEICD